MPYFLKHKAARSGPVEVVFGGVTVVAGLVATLAGGWLGDKLRARFAGSYFLVSGVAMLIGFPLMLAMVRAPFPAILVFAFGACFCLFFNNGADEYDSRECDASVVARDSLCGEYFCDSRSGGMSSRR